MRRRPSSLLSATALLGLLWCGGCGLLPKKDDGIPEATLPSWIGRVVMADADNRFALVDTGAPRTIPPGVKLVSFRDKRRTSSLAATAESRPPYLALEITEGMPANGDQVALDESVPTPPPTQ